MNIFTKTTIRRGLRAVQFCLLMAAAFLGWGISPAAHAQSTSWLSSASNGLWASAVNWSNGIPSGSQGAVINAGGTNGPVLTSDVSTSNITVGYGILGVGNKSGILTINSGGILRTSLTSYIGSSPTANAGQAGTVTLNSGGKWISNGDIIVGQDSSNGTLNILGGSSVTASSMVLGADFGSNSPATVLVDGAGSLLQLSGGITVGANITGNLTISNGGKLISQSATIGGNGVSTVATVNSNGLLQTAGDITLVNGTTNLFGGQITVNSGAGTVHVESQANLLIGNGSAGTLNAEEVSGDSAPGGVNPEITFLTPNGYVFAPNLTNNLEIYVKTNVAFTGLVQSTASIGGGGYAVVVQSGATMQIGNGGTSGTLDSNVLVNDSSNLAFNRSDTATFAANISAGTNSSLRQVGSGTVRLSGTLDRNFKVSVTGAPLVVTSDWDMQGQKSGSGTLILLGSTGSNFAPTVTAGVLQLGEGGSGAPTYANRPISLVGGELDFNQGGDVTYPGQIFGGGGLRKLGADTVTLSAGVVSYTGNTIIENGSLVRSNPVDTTWESQVSGAGTFVKDGVGQLTLDWSLLQTGGTIVRQGILYLNDETVTAPITVEQSGTVRVKGTVSTPITGDGGILVGNEGSTLTVMVSTVDVNGQSTVLSGGNLFINTTVSNTLAGNWQINSGGTFTTSTGSSALYLTGTVANQGTFLISGKLTEGGGADGFGGSGAITGGATVNGTLELNNGNADTGINSGNFTGNGQLVKNGGGNAFFKNATVSARTVTINGGGLQLESSSITSASVVLNAGTLYLYKDNTLSSSVTGSGRVEILGPDTVTMIGTLANTLRVQIDDGGLQIGDGTKTGFLNGNILNNGVLIFKQPFAYTYTGVVDGDGAVIQSGTSTVTLAGDNTYRGGTQITSGTLQVGAGGSTGKLGSGNVTNNGALVYNRSGTLSEGNAISGTGGLWQTGPGLLALTGANTYTGATTISGGSLQIGDGGTAGSIASASIVDNAALIFNRGDSVTYGAVISGSGSVTQSGTGVLALASTNTYTGGTFLKTGRLDLAADNALGTGSLTITGGEIRASFMARTLTNALFTSGTFTLGRSTNFSNATTLLGNTTIIASNPDGPANADSIFGGPISGNFGITLAEGSGAAGIGTGAIVFSGSNSYTGGTTLRTRLSINDDSALGAAAGNVIMDGGTLRETTSMTTTRNFTLGAGGGTFEVNGFSAFAGTFSGTGNLTMAAGFMSIDASLAAYTGATIINGGAVKFQGNSFAATPATSGVVITAGSLYFGGDLTFASNITGAGNVIHEFAGTTVITGTASHTGGTTINGGAIQIGNGGIAGAIAGNVLLSNGGTLAFNRSDAMIFNGVISGTGGVTQLGSGRTTLTADSSYTGPTIIAAGSFLVEGTLSGSGLVNLTGGAIGGDGSIGGSLHFGLGSGIVFDPTRTLTINGATVTFDGFSMADIIGLDSSVALGTYALLDGPTTFDFANVANFGAANAYDLGDGKYAYFQSGSLDLVVVPEPAAWTLILLAGAGFFVRHRRRSPLISAGGDNLV